MCVRYKKDVLPLKRCCLTSKGNPIVEVRLSSYLHSSRDHFVYVPTSERWCYIVMASLICWALTQNDPWACWVEFAVLVRPDLYIKSGPWFINILRPDKMAGILQTAFSNAFSSMKKFEFQLRFECSLLLRVQLTISQYWFSYWLGAEHTTSHFLNQCWPRCVMFYSITRLQWVYSFCVKIVYSLEIAKTSHLILWITSLFDRCHQV